LWSFERTDKFIKQSEKLDTITKKKLRDALKILAKSEKPSSLGDYKKSLGIFAYKLNQSVRLLYAINWNDEIIELIRVGDHKQVYGKG